MTPLRPDSLRDSDVEDVGEKIKVTEEELKGILRKVVVDPSLLDRAERFEAKKKGEIDWEKRESRC